MNEIWIAFIVLCLNSNCDGTKVYAKKGDFTLDLCREDARNWAIFTKLQTGKEYGFGCEKNTFEPKEIK